METQKGQAAHSRLSMHYMSALAERSYTVCLDLKKALRRNINSALVE